MCSKGEAITCIPGMTFQLTRHLNLSSLFYDPKKINNSNTNKQISEFQLTVLETRQATEHHSEGIFQLSTGYTMQIE